MSAGAAGLVSLAYGLELGSNCVEETRTDFETESLLSFEAAADWGRRELVMSYETLGRLREEFSEAIEGEIFFCLGPFKEDAQILMYFRYVEGSAILCAHNLDPTYPGVGHVLLEDLPWIEGDVFDWEVLYDTYSFLVGDHRNGFSILQRDEIRVPVMPLQSLLVRLTFTSESQGKRDLNGDPSVA